MKNSLLLHGGIGSESSLSALLQEYASKAFDNKSSLNSVVNATVLMEDDPIFNAGTGSYQRIDGTIQMDAAVMTETGFGSVIGVEKIRNPVKLALDVMQKTPHLIMAGDGALRLARMLGYEEYDPNTQKAQEQREKVMSELASIDSEKNPRFSALKRMGDISKLIKPEDTVGAVAYVNGTFAAAVSTGGATPMLRGRVGDSPIPGAGIYCGPKGAVVATGFGEEIIKHMLCISVYNDIGSKNLSSILEERTKSFDGPVGLIAIDKNGYSYFSSKPMAVGSFSSETE
ncbi:MAG: isoaspartyl peptidase/L-asparaginase [Candidatus Thermoplasmatota archaeon]|nr:isoaspartyl peptidase/L-asparaginase [Candidatus Thermoplasmatota archaeon]